MAAQEVSLTLQARWYVYSEMQISKRSFENKNFRNLIALHGDPVLTVKGLKAYVQAEFSILVQFVKQILTDKREQALPPLPPW